MPPPLAIAPTPAELLLRATLLARSVVTETVYDNPAPTGLTQEGPKKAGIPIAPIAGGAAGGALLACILCAAWIVWGRSIKRKEAKEKAEQLREHTTRANTRRNASRGASRTRAPARGSYSLPPPRAVKFSSDGSPSGSGSASGDTSSDDESVREKPSPQLSPRLDEKYGVAMPPPVLKHAPARPSPLRQGLLRAPSAGGVLPFLGRSPAPAVPVALPAAVDSPVSTPPLTPRSPLPLDVPRAPSTPPPPAFAVSITPATPPQDAEPAPFPAGPSLTTPSASSTSADADPPPAVPRPRTLSGNLIARLARQPSAGTVASSAGSQYSAQSGEDRRRSGWRRLSAWSRTGSVYEAIGEEGGMEVPPIPDDWSGPRAI